MHKFAFEVIGHRGCEGLAPENSLASMRKAIALGIDRVEFDINVARGGELVVIHDRAVRVCLRHVPVSRLDRVAIAKAKGVPLDGVPPLSAVLDVCKGKIKIQAELKADGIEAKVVRAIEASCFPLTDASISSFVLRRLTRVREAAPSLLPVQLVLLLDKGNNVFDAADDALREGIGSLSCHVSRVTRELVTALHDQGIRVLAWGLGERSWPRSDVISIYELLRGKGVDGFTCAYPDVLVGMVRADRSTR